MRGSVKGWEAIIAAVLAAVAAYFGARPAAPPAVPPVAPPGVLPPVAPEIDIPPVIPRPMPPRPDPMAAIGRISFGNAGCSATIIGPRRDDGRYWVLTANHCVAGQPRVGTMRLRDGRHTSLQVVNTDPRADCCWCVTDIPSEPLPYALLADQPPPIGAKVWHAGYGIDKPGNVESGKVSTGILADGKMGMILSVSSGDSGGGICLSDTGEVVSCVCCTSGMARQVQMYGAGVPAIRAARPAVLTADEWLPVPIPIVPDHPGGDGGDRRLPP